MANGIRTGDSRGFNKGRSSKFREGSRVRHTPEDPAKNAIQGDAPEGSDEVWGPEKMLMRCSKESQHPPEWALGFRLSSPREQERHNVTVITVGSKYYSLCSVSSSLSQ